MCGRRGELDLAAQNHGGKFARRGFPKDSTLFPHGNPVAVLGHAAARLAEEEISRCIEPPSRSRVRIRGKNRQPGA